MEPELVQPLDPDVAGVDQPEQPDPAARPLRLPRARDRGEHRVAGRLGGHTTSAGWLPADLWDELTAAREEHGRLRERCQRELDALAKLERDWRAEDAAYVKRLKDAAREGREPPADSRTPPAERQAQRDGLLDRAWAALAVLADHVDGVVDLVRRHEAEWLGGLREQYAKAGQVRRDLERQVAEAESEEWRAAQLGAWLQGISDGTTGRGQPAPGFVPRPSVVHEQVIDRALTRPWWQPQPQSAA